MKFATTSLFFLTTLGLSSAFSNLDLLCKRMSSRCHENLHSRNSGWGGTRLPFLAEGSTATSLRSIPVESSNIILASAEGWRQYVPLIVICGVLVDIVLGSPLANIALSPMKRAAEQVDGDSGDDDSNTNKFVRNPNERVDSDNVADAALQRARYSMELRKFLDENKTDEQKYEEIRKKIDLQAQQLEDNLDKLS